MHASDKVRVAKPLWFEEDAALLGAPFFVMNKVSGRVPVSYPPYSRQGWLFDASPAQRRRAWEEAVRQLASIQLVCPDNARFLELPGGPNHFDQEIDRWRRYLDWVDPGHKQSLLRECWSQLMAKKPANRPEGIVWGDSRLGNMMFGDDFSVVAVMDWEHPSLGGALHDLGWWLCGDLIQTTAQGLKPLEGMGTRDETITLWSETGGKSAADIEWYVAFGFFKMESTGVRMTTLREMPAPAKTPHIPGTMTKKLLSDLE
jgi:aminoglycoside phosphotransferase (APT) family kinase protein